MSLRCFRSSRKNVRSSSGAFFLHEAGNELRLMIVRQRKQVDHRAARARLRVERAEVDGFDACVDDGAGAHRARLERYIQVAAVQPPSAELAGTPFRLPRFRRDAGRFSWFHGGSGRVRRFSVADHDRADRTSPSSAALCASFSAAFMYFSCSVISSSNFPEQADFRLLKFLTRDKAAFAQPRQ